MATAIAGCVCNPVLADIAVPPTPAETWGTWNWDPVLLLNLLLLWLLYGRGLSRTWLRAGAGYGVRFGQPAAFLAGLACLALALMSPLDALADQLASAHMAQHLLLTNVAAPLFVLGAAERVLLRGLPRPLQRTTAPFRRVISSRRLRMLWHPLYAWLAFLGVVYFWHLPALYEAAIRDPVVHDAQHLSFFGAACLFWRPLLHPITRRRLHPAAAVGYLLMISLVGSVLGIFMSFSRWPWYSTFESTTAAWGFSPLEDQQLAGLMMWMPAGLMYAIAATVIFGVWLARQPADAAGLPNRSQDLAIRHSVTGALPCRKIAPSIRRPS